MKLSTTVRYGTRLMLDMAEQQGKGPIRIRTIASRQGISEKYLEKIVRLLRKAGLVDGLRGPGGGYVLSKAPDEITLADILEAVQGRIELCPCLGEPETCEKHLSCKTRKVWNDINQVIWTKLKKISLSDLRDSVCPGEDEMLDEPEFQI
ncbi:RrF2 family transcriptional regulator [Desulfonatronovibrio hydrogenovorans]|uniref:RrF2 family transcriptional regulator n=1 Tax=Desulfonatronovibrio hydrogenovorans TaxID=53245 RepID=UPI00055264B7|nr:Rrf2 family transcriptional regulator [Desulfonatronovibrio hydrogenovorans]